jgi:putative nucleotidyltransferase with HDIG domain
LCKLPVFRPVALKMVQLLGNEDAELQELARLLRSDPALSAQVLRVANSALYGNSHAIDNLGRAILVLGFDRTRSLTLTFALKSLLRGVESTAVMGACWQHSLATALLAEELSQLYEISKDQAYMAGLLHDVGRLGLLMAYGDRYTPVLESRHDTLASCLESERVMFEMDHCQAGLWLTQRWGFPPEYSRVAGCHHDEVPAARQDLVSLTHIACLLADALGFPAVVLADAPSAGEIVSRLPVNRWKRYAFQEDDLKSRIANQIASSGKM